MRDPSLNHLNLINTVNNLFDICRYGYGALDRRSCGNHD